MIDKDKPAKNKTAKRKHNYYIKNLARITENAKKRYKKNKKEILEQCRKYHQGHKDQINKRKRRYYQENKEKIHKRILRNNPDIIRQKEKDKMTRSARYGSFLGLSASKYMTAIKHWSTKIKKKFNYKCQVCGNWAELSHHLIYRSTEPKLSFNLNNGIALCRNCHNEVHGFGVWVDWKKKNQEKKTD